MGLELAMGGIVMDDVRQVSRRMKEDVGVEHGRLASS